MKEQRIQYPCKTCKNITTWSTKFGDVREGCKATNTTNDVEHINYDPKENICESYTRF